MAIQFDNFKRTLYDAFTDEDFRRKNTVAQDTTWADQIETRLDALTSDFNVKETFAEVLDSSGLLTTDPTYRRLKFDPVGFSVALSKFREGTVDTPESIWLRSTAPTDNIRYLLTDSVKGVILLGENLEVIRLFPGFGTDVAGNEYDAPSSAITFTVAATEYVAVAMSTHHVVHIYDYLTGAFVARIGTVDTEGTPDAGDFVDTPVDLAFNAATEELWIACGAGTPPGATADNGFLAKFDVSTPAAPTWILTPYYYSTDGSLLHGQVHTPAGIYFDPDLDALWVSNGSTLNEVGAFDDTTGYLVKFLEATTATYQLSSPSSLRVRDCGAGVFKLYIANGDYGTVEVFNITTTKWVTSYGFRSTEDNALSQSSYVFGSIGSTTAAVPDTVPVDGTEVDVVVVGDDLNSRVQRINEDAYTTDNYVNFTARTFDVPIRVVGWSVTGDVPTDLCTVSYKSSSTDDWHILDGVTDVPYSSYFQFRIAVNLSTGRIVRPWYITRLTIIGEQV